jgi:hypothetical protein
VLCRAEKEERLFTLVVAVLKARFGLVQGRGESVGQVSDAQVRGRVLRGEG